MSRTICKSMIHDLQMNVTIVEVTFQKMFVIVDLQLISQITVLPTKSDSGVMFCFKCYQGLIIDRSLVY